jgi:hypothetical protein
MSDFMNKGQVSEAFSSASNFGKRALPLLPSILKFARLKTLLLPYAEENDSIRTSVLAAAEHTINPETGQEISVSPDSVNKTLVDLMHTMSAFTDPGIRITEEDLPRLPDWSDDPEKQKKYIVAREDLANDIAGLGPLFAYKTEVIK